VVCLLGVGYFVGTRWNVDFSLIVPVQNREKEKDAASSPSYDVSSYVPSCKAGWEEVLRGVRG